MEVRRENRVRNTYYFSWPDQEILEDRFLALSCDEETWLYKVETNFKRAFHYVEVQPHFQDHQGGTVDSRTFTRRKHCALRPSLELVVGSPLSNRSSLGLLSSSKLLNDTLQTPLENQEKTSSSFIGFDRGFKLDSPFTNLTALGGSNFTATNCILERTSFSTDLSDISNPYSLENCSFIEKNGQMTDSLLNFLEKQDSHPPRAESLVAESCRKNGDQINYKPSSDMTDSVVNVHEVDAFPTSEMTDSVKDYLENVNYNCPSVLIKHSAVRETENIPPSNCVNIYQNGNGSKSERKAKECKKIDSTFEVDKNSLIENTELDDGNITFTNTVNTERKSKEKSGFKDGISIQRTLNTTYEKCNTKESSENCLNERALNNKDLNLNEMFKRHKQIPSKHSSINTTFTKLPLGGSVCSKLAHSVEMLNEEDTTSSASDSSCSSSKPRSVDELRTIAKQQETSLVQQTSTPVLASNNSKLVDMDISLSPIRRQSSGGESRSANSSPVRSQQPHPLSRLKQPTTGVNCKMVPATSLSNIARPKISGLRIPKPVSRFTVPQKVEPAAPSKTLQGIPRPQISRLPMPRFRGPSVKKGGL